MFNVNGLMQMIGQMSANPQQILQRFNIPQDCNTPESVAKYLMDNGRVSQAQVEQANQMYKQIFRR
jgi:hypothetical protein